MRTEQEIKNRIKELKRAHRIGEFTELQWVLEGVDETEELKKTKRYQRIRDRKWFVKKLGSEYMQGKVVHHDDWGYMDGVEGFTGDTRQAFCLVMDEEEHKRHHGKKVGFF